MRRKRKISRITTVDRSFYKEGGKGYYIDSKPLINDMISEISSSDDEYSVDTISTISKPSTTMYAAHAPQFKRKQVAGWSTMRKSIKLTEKLTVNR